MPVSSPRRLEIETLEPRCVPAVTAALAGGVLAIVGDAARDHIRVSLDGINNQLVVRDFVDEVARFDSAAVASIAVNAGGGDDVVKIDPQVTQPATIDGGDGRDILRGGSGATTLLGATGPDKLRAGAGPTTLDGDGGRDLLFNVKPIDTAVVGAEDRVCFALPVIPPPVASVSTLTTDDVNLLLRRAGAATASTDAIIAIVDRGGRLLGLRIEDGVSPAITGNTNSLVFAVDGALAEARTAAFFANDTAPLTFAPRAVHLADDHHAARGRVEPEHHRSQLDAARPWFRRAHRHQRSLPARRAVHAAGRFVRHRTHQSRQPPAPRSRPDQGHRRRCAAGSALQRRPRVQRQHLSRAGVVRIHLRPRSQAAQARGIGTLPGGIPIFKDGQLVGGIGVFFPGTTGYATEENSALDALYDPTKPDRTLEAEYIAFAAVGGLPGDSVRTSAPSLASPRWPASRCPTDASISSASRSTSSAPAAARGRTVSSPPAAPSARATTTSAPIGPSTAWATC